jgi:hypothetical protein
VFPYGLSPHTKSVMLSSLCSSSLILMQDIHHVVQLSCHGTLGERYITSRQYQLDDSLTSVAVNPIRFAEDHLKDGKVFEVAIQLGVVQEAGVEADSCPKCGFRHEESDQQPNGWIRW